MVNKKQLNECFEALGPSEEQKERMLNNIINSKQNKSKQKGVYDLQAYKWRAIAASCLVVIGIGVGSTWYQQNISMPPVHSSPMQSEDFSRDLDYFFTIEEVGQRLETIEVNLGEKGEEQVSLTKEEGIPIVALIKVSPLSFPSDQVIEMLEKENRMLVTLKLEEEESITFTVYLEANLLSRGSYFYELSGELKTYLEALKNNF